MQFDPDESTISRERALSMFVKDSDLRTDRYRFAVKNPIQFRLIIGYLFGRHLPLQAIRQDSSNWALKRLLASPSEKG
jgi:hypothetical protein